MARINLDKKLSEAMKRRGILLDKKDVGKMMRSVEGGKKTARMLSKLREDEDISLTYKE